jgi:uncharacterized protein (TIGR02284 family)
MIFQLPQTSKTTEVLNDLICINDDRVEGYKTALSQSASLIPELQDTLCVIISDGINYRHQLAMRIKQFGALNVKEHVPGNIYQAWNDLKGVFATGSQKSVITSCLYNEEVALHAYKAALCIDNIRRSEAVFQMITAHEKGLKENHNILKSYRDVRHLVYAPLMYLA